MLLNGSRLPPLQITIAADSVTMLPAVYESPSMADDEAAAPQEAAFYILFDTTTHRLLGDLEAADTQDALDVLNREGRTSIAQVEAASKFSCGLFLCQGICLLAAGFHEAGWMEPAYEGPESPLKACSVTILRSFKGRKDDTV